MHGNLYLAALVTNSEQSPETQVARAGALYARYETEGRRSCAPDKAERVFGIRNKRALLIFCANCRHNRSRL